MSKILVTGSTGLIGSEAVKSFAEDGSVVYGIDNNMRKQFFGDGGDTTWVRKSLEHELHNYFHFDVDIQNYLDVQKVVIETSPDVVVHCAAQPSHDLAAKIPHLDFSVNAVGTLNLLESVRQYAPSAVFVYMSTNKVYGDRPNQLSMVEKETRFDFAEKEFHQGIDENFSVDQSTHSLFGCSKLSADILVQEYGRNFGIQTGVFRGGCLTGPNHSSVSLHGFLSYLTKCVIQGHEYTVFGYKGKQVRDQIHSKDVISAIKSFVRAPRPGEVYNIGGGLENSASIIECIEILQQKTARSFKYSIVPQNRVGDHICYYSDMSKFKSHYPEWRIEYSLDRILDELIDGLKSS